MLDMETLNESCRAARSRLPPLRPLCTLVLGSGWDGVVDDLAVRGAVDYTEIPCLGGATVAGHSGHLLAAALDDRDILVFRGRRHWYEGLGWEPVVFPAVLAGELGCPNLVLTNAAGGIRDDLGPGTLMVIDDHINAIPGNPLAGPHRPELGPRFPDQGNVYDPGLRGMLDAAARDAGHPVAHGVYIATPGPSYETPAEIRAYRALGADAVGMSTVPEAIVANAAGRRVAGISCIANRAAGSDGEVLTHDGVMAATAAAAPRMRALLTGFLRRVTTRS